jgi:hypothetical protein
VPVEGIPPPAGRETPGVPFLWLLSQHKAGSYALWANKEMNIKDLLVFSPSLSFTSSAKERSQVFMKDRCALRTLRTFFMLK